MSHDYLSAPIWIWPNQLSKECAQGRAAPPISVARLRPFGVLVADPRRRGWGRTGFRALRQTADLRYHEITRCALENRFFERSLPTETFSRIYSGNV